MNDVVAPVTRLGQEIRRSNPEILHCVEQTEKINSIVPMAIILGIVALSVVGPLFSGHPIVAIISGFIMYLIGKAVAPVVNSVILQPMRTVRYIPFFHGEAALAGWKHVIDAVHAAGGRMGPQIWHTGSTIGMSGWEPEAPVESPSGLVGPGQPRGLAMSEEAISDTWRRSARQPLTQKGSASTRSSCTVRTAT